MKRRSHHCHVDMDILSLAFERRRYDGGSEIELIAFIENQRRHSALRAMDAPMAAMETLSSQTRPKKNRAAAPSRPATSSRTRKALEAIVRGPAAMAVGAVGIVTSLVAVCVFSQGKHAVFAAQSRELMRECAIALSKGFIDTLVSPARAAQAVVFGG